MIATCPRATAASAFDEARRIGLPYRMLWYQFGPFEAYLRVGRYQDVIDRTADTALKINISWQTWYPACSTAPWQLDDEARDQYMSMIGQAYSFNQNFARAEERIGAFNFDNPGVEIARRADVAIG